MCPMCTDAPSALRRARQRSQCCGCMPSTADIAGRARSNATEPPSNRPGARGRLTSFPTLAGRGMTYRISHCSGVPPRMPICRSRTAVQCHPEVVTKVNDRRGAPGERSEATRSDRTAASIPELPQTKAVKPASLAWPLGGWAAPRHENIGVLVGRCDRRRRGGSHRRHRGTRPPLRRPVCTEVSRRWIPCASRSRS
jgi:hypothetical protein